MQENLILVGDNPTTCTGADGYTSSREIFLLQFASILYAATKSMVDGFLPARRSLFLMAQNGHFSKNIVFQWWKNFESLVFPTKTDFHHTGTLPDHDLRQQSCRAHHISGVDFTKKPTVSDVNPPYA